MIQKNYDYRKWARDIVAGWDNGSYPANFTYAYGLACKVVGIQPKAHPTKARREAYRADIDG